MQSVPRSNFIRFPRVVGYRVPMAIADVSRKQPTHPIGSVENALRLLVMLRDRPSIRVSDAGNELGVARSTAHRLLAMLHAYGLVEQDPQSRAYRTGPVLAELGLAALRQDDVLTTLHPFLQELSEKVGETTHLIVLDGANGRFVDSVESRHNLRTTSRIGVVYPAYQTSGGKALLAELDEEELRRVYPRRRLPRLSDRAPTSRDELFEELALIRKRGYATSFAAVEVGINAVAVVQRTSRGAVPAAMAISAPEQRLPESRVPELVEALRDVTERARARLP
jgi:IclR family transcriptional regulator, acetate operon repressor